MNENFKLKQMCVCVCRYVREIERIIREVFLFCGGWDFIVNVGNVIYVHSIVDDIPKVTLLIWISKALLMNFWRNISYDITSKPPPPNIEESRWKTWRNLDDPDPLNVHHKPINNCAEWQMAQDIHATQTIPKYAFDDDVSHSTNIWSTRNVRWNFYYWEHKFFIHRNSKWFFLLIKKINTHTLTIRRSQYCCWCQQKPKNIEN